MTHRLGPTQGLGFLKIRGDKIMHPKLENAKQHIKDHQTAYILGTSVAVAGITCLIMRGVASQPISRGFTATASHGFTVTGKKVVMNNVSY